MTHTTREGWLVEATQALRETLFEPHTLELSKNIRVSCGFCGGTKVIGLCVSQECASDQSINLFVDPQLDDPVKVLDVLTHELCHAHCRTIGLDCKHKGKFAKIIRILGLEGKPTATFAGDELKATLTSIAVRLGDYPHAAVKRTTKPAKKHAWVSFVSKGHEEEYIVRANKNVVKELGPPKDPWGEDMVPKDPEDLEGEEEEEPDPS
jgi:hypothetical protein